MTTLSKGLHRGDKGLRIIKRLDQYINGYFVIDKIIRDSRIRGSYSNLLEQVPRLKRLKSSNETNSSSVSRRSYLVGGVSDVSNDKGLCCTVL